MLNTLYSRNIRSWSRMGDLRIYLCLVLAFSLVEAGGSHPLDSTFFEVGNAHHIPTYTPAHDLCHGEECPYSLSKAAGGSMDSYQGFASGSEAISVVRLRRRALVNNEYESKRPSPGGPDPQHHGRVLAESFQELVKGAEGAMLTKGFRRQEMVTGEYGSKRVSPGGIDPEHRAKLST